MQGLLILSLIFDYCHRSNRMVCPVLSWERASNEYSAMESVFPEEDLMCNFMKS